MRRIFEDRTAALGVSESGSGRGKVTLPRPENAVIDRKDDDVLRQDRSAREASDSGAQGEP